jgi:hypothetical protein
MDAGEQLLMTKLLSALESTSELKQQINRINENIESLDRTLRGYENIPGLVARVQILEKTHKTIWVVAGAFGGAFTTLLAAYISKGHIP